MTNDIRNIETLKSIQPNQVIAYLKQNGWQKESCIQDKAEIWIFKHKGSDKECADILLPLNISFQDYPIRMSEILATLETVAGRSKKEIFKILTYQRPPSRSQDIRKGKIYGQINNGSLSRGNYVGDRRD